MTNMEYIQSCSKDELAKFLCREMNLWCPRCPAYKYCHPGRIGFLDWFDKERGEKE